MGNVIYGNFNRHVTASPTNCNYNQVLHLRAHGWCSYVFEGRTIFSHPEVMNSSWLPFSDAWQAQKAIEIGMRYWK